MQVLSTTNVRNYNNYNVSKMPNFRSNFLSNLNIINNTAKYGAEIEKMTSAINSKELNVLQEWAKPILSDKGDVDVLLGPVTWHKIIDGPVRSFKNHSLSPAEIVDKYRKQQIVRISVLREGDLIEIESTHSVPDEAKLGSPFEIIKDKLEGILRTQGNFGAVERLRTATEQLKLESGRRELTEQVISTLSEQPKTQGQGGIKGISDIINLGSKKNAVDTHVGHVESPTEQRVAGFFDNIQGSDLAMQIETLPKYIEPSLVDGPDANMNLIKTGLTNPKINPFEPSCVVQQAEALLDQAKVVGDVPKNSLLDVFRKAHAESGK